MATANVLIPRSVIRKGDIVTLKAIIAHPMETGFRRTETGGEIPRNIIRHVSCHYDGVEVFSCDFHPSISANPFLAFTTIATKTGPVSFIWTGDNGFRHVETAIMNVTD
ncbi:MAG: thiosulfate oxidation carrier complex protein SoxZ [Rhizobiales bacterium]|nr:thiosulfate oxidation carrier complex protein SoxZ [Hyphomicrobiales bacterium]